MRLNESKRCETSYTIMYKLKISNIMKKSNDLLALAMAQTTENISKGRSSKKSINDCLLELLYKKEPMTKLQLVGAISLERLHNEFDGEVTAENFGSKEVQKEFKRINKTVSNGFDTATCNGKTSASFCSNKDFDKYEIIKDRGTYTIVDKEPAKK